MEISGIGLFLLYLLQISEAIRPLSRGGTHHAVAATDTSLPCYFDLEGDQLYSILWWKGQTIVGKYLPRRGQNNFFQKQGHKNISHNPKSAIYQQIQVDSTGLITGSELILLRVKMDFEDKFVCEITSDTIGFQTVNTTYYVKVIAAPERVPLLYSPRGRIIEGAEIKAVCYSAPVSPSAHISFLLNGSPMDDSFMTSSKKHLLNSGQTILERGMSFRAQRELFQQGLLTMDCAVSLDDITWKTSASVYLTGYNFSNSGVKRQEFHIIHTLVLTFVFMLSIIYF